MLFVFKIYVNEIPPKKKDDDRIITANKNFIVIKKSMYNNEKSKLILKMIIGPTKIENPHSNNEIKNVFSVFNRLKSLRANPPRPRPKIETDKIKNANV
ncbi:hypothetical protein D9V86_03340 [Bacteroidetes/Chlorobi group bacterium ChocPot_Mid]|nr:MAG: hypothetical protein D9V86_03340 [Bacteroidetes/Chlorobi group bacterium ChocPot_Mid]